MKIAKGFIAPLLSFLLVFGWMFFFFQDVFFHPNAHLFNSQGDGIKAFYVFADHIKNDESYHQQRNMNFPYGQTHIYTDGQTGIANLLKLLSSISPFFTTHSIAIYNYLILWSFMVCGFCITLLLRRFNLPFLFSVAGGVCIAILSPQIIRISGHPTMSYAFFFPLSWYLLLKIIDREWNWKFLLVGLLNTIFWFFVHPYLGMVITFFYTAFLFIQLIHRKGRSFLDRRSLISFILLIALPVVVLKVYTAAVDFHVHRSEFPWGFWIFYTSPSEIFLPHNAPFGFLVDYYLNTRTELLNMEKLYYVGLAVDLVLLVVMVRIFRQLIKKNFFHAFQPAMPQHMNTSFWAAFFVLLFAMCFPFNMGLRALVDHIGFLRQFRALGRFAWAFYYVSTVYAVCVFYYAFRYLRMKNLRLLSGTFALFFFTMFLIEAYADFDEKSKWAVLPKNVFNEALLPDEDRSLIDEIIKVRENYQCIVPLPFFHVGTENYGVDFTEQNIGISLIASYWTNMPLLASSAARSPMLEGKNIMQFFSPPFIHKEIEKDLPSRKNFLILYDKESLNPEEIKLMEKSSKLYGNDKYELRSVTYDAVFEDNSRQVYEHYLSVADSLLIKNSFEVSGNPDLLIYKSFDSLRSQFNYRGQGALHSKKKEMTILYESKGILKPDVDYTVSYWYYNEGELRNQALCGVEECDGNGENCKWEIIWDPRTSMVIDGNWSLIEKTFRLKDPSTNIRIFIKGDNLSEQDIFIDEFLLRPAASDVYAQKKSGKDALLFYNNRWVRKP